MLEAIKIISKFIIGLVFGFGFWFLIFWFVTNERNAFEWHWITKIVYLIFGFASAQGTIKALVEED